MRDLFLTIYICTYLYVPEHAMLKIVDRNVAGFLPASIVCREGLTVREVKPWDSDQWTSMKCLQGRAELEQLHMESNSQCSQHLFIPQLHDSLT